MNHPRDDPILLQVVLNKLGLMELQLSGRGLEFIPQQVFTISKLEMLLLANNKLSSIPNTISQLHKLRLLDASQNKLTSLPETLSNCTHLTELYLHSNRLFSLPAQLKSFYQLRSLRLSSNFFEALPANFGDMSSLRRLDVADNSLWYLPDSFKDLQNLTQLNLSENTFVRFPLQVSALRRLEILDLSKNKLVALPEDMENVKSLRNINLSSNQFEIFPTVLCNAKKLEHLNLSENHLTSVSARLTKLPNLKVLLLYKNSLTLLLDNLPAVEFLNLSGNRLRTMSVVNMKRLRHLDAGGNQLESMPDGLFNLADLEVLMLNNNRINYVSQDIVLLRKLKTLDLSNNALKMLPHSLEEMKSLEFLNVAGNLAKFGKTLQNHGTAYLLKPANSTAPGQEGRLESVFVSQMPFGGKATLSSSAMVEINGKGDDAMKSGMIDPAQAVSEKRANSKWKQRVKEKSRRKDNYREYDDGGFEEPSHTAPKFDDPDRSRFVDSDNLAEVEEISYPLTNSNFNDVYPELSHHDDGNLSLNSIRGSPITSDDTHRSPRMLENQTKLSPRGAFENSKVRRSPGVFENKTQRSAAGMMFENKTQRSSNIFQNRNVLEFASRDVGYAKNARYDDDNCSATVTINDAVGDDLSLGDDDFEYVPLNIQDDKLMQMATDLEMLLNKQLLQPIFHSSRSNTKHGK